MTRNGWPGCIESLTQSHQKPASTRENNETGAAETPQFSRSRGSLGLGPASGVPLFLPLFRLLFSLHPYSEAGQEFLWQRTQVNGQVARRPRRDHQSDIKGDDHVAPSTESPLAATLNFFFKRLGTTKDSVITKPVKNM